MSQWSRRRFLSSAGVAVAVSRACLATSHAVPDTRNLSNAVPGGRGEEHVGIGTDGTVTTIDDLEAYKAALAKEVEARRAAGISAAGERPDTLPFTIDLRGVNQFRELADRMEQRGYSSARIERILGRNFMRYASDVWGACNTTAA